MEPHVAIGDWKNQKPSFTSLEEYYCRAHAMCEDMYRDQLEHFRCLRLDMMTPTTFWWEYVWVVYLSGFNAKVMSGLWPTLRDAMGDWNCLSLESRWHAVRLVIGNRRKYEACEKAARIIASYDSWEQFKKDYLCDVSAMRKLPYVGPITCYHLARNVGLDAVKPDLHLVRLADHFDWPDPETMCSYLSGLFDERLGVVDLILWYAASTWGTLEISRGR